MTTQTAPDLEFVPLAPDELPLIRELINRLDLDPEDLAPEQFTTLRHAGRIVAFGRIRPIGDTYELGAVGVVEGERGHGYGAAIVRELIRRFPQDEVYITTHEATYFERLGFLRTEIIPPDIKAHVDRVHDGPQADFYCMLYDRNIERLPTIADVYRAKHLIEPHLAPTPLLHNPAISREFGFDAYLKLENLHPIGAFKVRGGVNLCASMVDEERGRGIIGASTGNHGQSLAYGAHLCGMRCVIAMPEEANPMKVESMRALGAEVQFHGANFEEARAWAEDYSRSEGLCYIHHVNAPPLIAGVATLSLEIMEDLPDVDVILSPVGGGSATLGHCLVAKALNPNVEVIGVQAAGAPAVYNSWRERTLQQAPINTAAEGLATGHAYYTPVKTFIERLDDMLLVSEQQLRDAVVLLARTAHVIAEESGAAATAAAIQIAERLRGKKVAIVVSGGNMPIDHLRHVLLNTA